MYLRIEKRVLAYSVTSGASRRRDASVSCLAKHRDTTRRDATRHVDSLDYFGARAIRSRIEQLNDWLRLFSSSPFFFLLHSLRPPLVFDARKKIVRTKSRAEGPKRELYQRFTNLSETAEA